MNKKLSHCENLLSYKENELVLGDMTISKLIEKVGQTPFYVYDKKLIKERLKFLKSTLPPEISLHYAIKANPMPEVVNYIAGMVDGLDVASGLELDLAMNTRTLPHNISFAGPGKKRVRK